MYTRIDLHTKPTPYYDLYMGRANKWLSLPQSDWHNPIWLKREADRDTCLEQFEIYARNRSDLIQRLPEIFEKNLVLACWCPPHKTCHVDIWHKIYKEIYENSDKIG